MRLKKFELCGFRSFGPEPQNLAFSSDLAVVWGANSQGKSSLAEALEFLLTGTIVRRTLVASAQDEFADSLRNAHLPEDAVVYVEAELEAPGGAAYTLRRTLTADFGRKQDCSSELTIDGSPATETDLPGLGIVLSQPPLPAPILAQHTLSYLFSARPTERALYFKSLLEVTDLDEFHEAARQAAEAFSAASFPLLASLEEARTCPAIRPHLELPNAAAPSLASLRSTLEAAAGALLASEGAPIPGGLAAGLQSLRDLLNAKRSAAFPIDALPPGAPPTWTPPDVGRWKPLEDFVAQKQKVENETRRLSNLFTALLDLPVVQLASTALDCPVCETPAALTPERIAVIRKSLQDTRDYQAARGAVAPALAALTNAAALENLIQASAPPCLKWKPRERRRIGFRVARLSELLPNENRPLVVAWTDAARWLARTARLLRRASQKVSAALTSFASTPEALEDLAPIQSAFDGLTANYERFRVAHEAYRSATDALSAPLRAVVDAATKTEGWQPFLDLASTPEALHAVLLDHAARATLDQELRRTLNDIDRAKGKVLDVKFAALSSDVASWWTVLRPDEPTFFSALGRRAGAKRTIDFKAGLSAHDDRSDPKVRDVVAVFSQSQLHCLGLALFLARALRERTGLIVLDDPVLASDEEHRAHFNHSGIDKLLQAGCQTIVLTQDHTTFKELQNRYKHVELDTFDMILDDPRAGTKVRATSDDLIAMLARARPFLRSNEPELRKRAGERLRDAGERFCKELLVKERRSAGDDHAALGDYDGKSLGTLIPKVEPYLRDAGHPGRLHAIRDSLNPANHDGGIPDKGSLAVAHGDLDYFRKQYLN